MATFTDDFNRGNTTDLGAGWVEVSGDWSIVSNQLSPGAAGGTIILRAAGAMDTDDHYAQITIAATVAASQGVWCRGNSNISSGYLWRNDGSEWTLFSVVGGSFTAIGSYAAAAAPGDVAKVQAVGSTIKCYVNGVERVSITNSHVVTGTSVGIRSESAGALRFDDFAAADVTAGATLDTATAVEVAQPFTGTKTATFTPATGTHAAQPVTGSKTVELNTAASTQTAQPLDGTKASLLDTATAAETAQPPASTKTATLGPALETATAQPAAGTKTASATPGQTVEQAQNLAGSKTASLPTATAREQAQPLTSDTVPPPDIDVTVGEPYSQWTAGQPHTALWSVGAPH